jgi:undecaprenyl-diphosphatase
LHALPDTVVSVILGVVEGLTEFLPVSSTAHLRLAEKLMDIDLSNGYWKMYSIVIQLGAILCLPIYFRQRIIKFLKTFPKGERGDRTLFTHPLTLVMVAFVVTAIPAYALHKKIGENLESLKVIGVALFVGGIIMWAVDYWFGWLPDPANAPGPEVEFAGARAGEAQPAKAIVSSLDPNEVPSAPPIGLRPTAHMEEMSLGQAIWIGAAQILSAVFPGTSRSMSTIAAGQVTGMSRQAALEFSFFLSMPTMIVATGYEFLKTVVLKKAGHGDTLPPIEMNTHLWIVLIIGFVVSFFVAWGVVAWFMNWVRRGGFAPFAAYRILLGAGVLVMAFF